MAWAAPVPRMTPISTQARLIVPCLRFNPRVKNEIQPTNMAHTGTSKAITLSVAAEEAMTDSPSTTFRWVDSVLSVMTVLPRGGRMGLRRQQVSQADSAQELGADTIGDRVDHFTAVVG